MLSENNDSEEIPQPFYVLKEKANHPTVKD